MPATQPVMPIDPREAVLIDLCAERAVALAKSITPQHRVEKLNVMMDLCAVHGGSCKLDLEGLYAADDGNFGHDVFGIRRYLDRVSGELTECFLPRFAKKSRAGGRVVK